MQHEASCLGKQGRQDHHRALHQLLFEDVAQDSVVVPHVTAKAMNDNKDCGHIIWMRSGCHEKRLQILHRASVEPLIHAFLSIACEEAAAIVVCVLLLETPAVSAGNTGPTRI